MRNVIRVGDLTSHGGQIISDKSSHITVDGFAVACVGVRCTCSLHSDASIVAVDPDHTLDDTPVAYDGDRMLGFRSDRDMTMRLRFAIAVAIAVWGCSGAYAAALRAECPGIIPANAIKADKPVLEWVTVVPGQLHLKGAGMMAGAPDTKTYLVPHKATKETQMFEFAKGDERWAWCDYGAVELFRKLDDSATMCTITTKTRKPEFFISALVQCK